MITVQFQCNTIADLRSELRAFLGNETEAIEAGDIKYSISMQVPQVEEKAKDFDIEIAAPQEEPKKRTRRTKEQIEAEKMAKTSNIETENEKPTATSAPPQKVSVPKGYSKQDVHQALQQVNVAVGLPKSREILLSFGANRISEIREDQFKDFVDKCNEAVMLQG